MLHFFRKFQQYIFIVITIVIIISFSFFGTYSGMQSSTYEDPIAFVAVDGTKVKKSELEQFVQFIGSDAEEKRNFGAVWGPNFLNDGVIKANFLENGTLILLANAFSNDVSEELQTRLAKEKQFALYSHPQAKFISTEGIWKYFVPGMNQSYLNLKSSKDALTPEALDSRIKLFLGERQFPTPILRQMLLMQEKQYNWIEHDQNLNYNDLSLFGYHKAEDWFGPRLIRLAAEFIINSAIIAEERGYKITKEEAFADLARNASISFKQNQKSPQMDAKDVSQYMSEQFRRMGLDKTTAVKIWQQVLLFRRLINEMGNSVFVDPYTFTQYNSYAFEGSNGTLYQLPEEFRLGDSKSLNNFEVYLQSISSRGDSEKERMNLPVVFKSSSEIEKSTPELLQKRYLVEVSEISKKDLGSKVSLKEMWKWETQDKNWIELETKFPELGLAKATTSEERFNVLDKLDSATRSRIDNFARSAIVENHPEWIEQALNQATPKIITVTIPLKGGDVFIKGNKDRKALITLLDQAASGKSEENPINNYTEDHSNFYRISVLDKSNDTEIMTFAEASKSGVLQPLADSQMKNYYEKIKSKYPKLYQNDDKTWKNYDDVADSVIGKYYDNFVKEMGDDYVSAVIPKEDNKNLTMSRAASLRFIKHASDTKSEYSENVPEGNVEEQENKVNKLTPRKPLEDQWKFIARPFEIKKSSRNSTVDKAEALALEKGEWSKITAPANGDISFFHVTEKLKSPEDATLINQVNAMQRILGSEAQKNLSLQLISIMQSKGALSLDYLTSKYREDD